MCNEAGVLTLHGTKGTVARGNGHTMYGCDMRGGQDFAFPITGGLEGGRIYGAPESVWVLKRPSEQVRRSIFYFAVYVETCSTSPWTWSDVMERGGVPWRLNSGKEWGFV